MRSTGLPCVWLADRGDLPQCSGVYFVCSGEQVLYVGRSGDIRSRWKNHHRFDELSQFSEVRIYWIEAPAGFLETLERALIFQLAPTLNGRINLPLLIPFVATKSRFEPSESLDQSFNKLAVLGELSPERISDSQSREIALLYSQRDIDFIRRESEPRPRDGKLKDQSS